MSERPITIALDVMGSDHGIGPMVEGAARFSLESGGAEVLLVGDADAVHTALQAQRHDASRLAVIASDGGVSPDEDFRTALTERPNCSTNLSVALLAGGQADAMVSAAPTGAVILSTAAGLRRLPGVRKTALAAVYPTESKHGPRQDPFALMLDVGATVHASAADLVRFAVMGSTYAQVISANPNPKVALLSNGTENTKGTEAIVTAHDWLSRSEIVDFAGNVEGLDIPKGTVDVVVCEGFLGNVVLKMLEGVGEVVADLAKDAYARRFLWRLGLTMLSSGVRQLRTMTDWKQYGGAPLLGVDGVVVKAHGRSNPRAVSNALKVATKAVRGDLTGKIEAGLAEAARSGWFDEPDEREG